MGMPHRQYHSIRVLIMGETKIFLAAFLAIFLAASLVRWFLNRINIRHLRRFGHEIPDVFQGEIEAATLARMTDYTVESSRLESREHLSADLVTLIILFSGLFPWLVDRCLALNLSFVPSGLVLLALLGIISGAPGIPFKLYRTFVIEKKYGFSTITLRLWITDFLKGLLIEALLMAILLGAVLFLIQRAAGTWWLWVWLVFFLFQLLLVWLYPVVIAPLFNKYEPLLDDDLKDSIIGMMAKAGLAVGGVYQMDAGKRSRHTNAYFTGLGKTKRIVLYDTLLASHAQEEILAVLAHEIGHRQRKHILKQLIFLGTASLVILYIAWRLLYWPPLYHAFGVGPVIPYAGLFLLAVIFEPLVFFLKPLGTAVLRKFEREADDFSYELLGSSRPLCNALKRLAKDNLANLHPHPLYVLFNYSHPPLQERIARLQQKEAKKPA